MGVTNATELALGVKERMAGHRLGYGAPSQTQDMPQEMPLGCTGSEGGWVCNGARPSERWPCIEHRTKCSAPHMYRRPPTQMSVCLADVWLHAVRVMQKHENSGMHWKIILEAYRFLLESTALRYTTECRDYISSHT